MIEITSYTQRKYLLHPDSIAVIMEASTSSYWHGVRSIVKLFDGVIIESDMTVGEIHKLIQGDK